MERKKGITTLVIILSVFIMFIILTTATVIGSRNINTVNYEEFMSKLNRVSNTVNEYILKNDNMPILDSHTVIAKTNLTEDLKTELQRNGDFENNNLYVIDMNKLNVNNVNIGIGTVQDRDVFLIAEDTHNIYYYKGYKYRNKMYYSELVPKALNFARIPNMYQEIEYIESTGTQYIDTGIIPNNNTKIIASGISQY